MTWHWVEVGLLIVGLKIFFDGRMHNIGDVDDDTDADEVDDDDDANSDGADDNWFVFNIDKIFALSDLICSNALSSDF